MSQSEKFNLWENGVVLSFDFVVDDLGVADLLYHFSRDNKWFPYCLKKMDISPNVIKLDVSQDIWAFRDEEWAKQHLKNKSGKEGH